MAFVNKSCCGFTFVELLIVVAILVILGVSINHFKPSRECPIKNIKCYSGEKLIYQGAVTKVRGYDGSFNFTESATGKHVEVYGDCVIEYYDNVEENKELD